MHLPMALCYRVPCASNPVPTRIRRFACGGCEVWECAPPTRRPQHTRGPWRVVGGAVMAVGGRAQGRLKARLRRAIHSLLHTAPCPTCALTSVRVLVIASLSRTHSHDTRGRIIATLTDSSSHGGSRRGTRGEEISRPTRPLHFSLGFPCSLASWLGRCARWRDCVCGDVWCSHPRAAVPSRPLALLAWHHPAPSLRRKLVRMAAHNKVAVVCGAPSCSARGCALCRTHLLSHK
jgi:hypothetical protein